MSNRETGTGLFAEILQTGEELEEAQRGVKKLKEVKAPVMEEVSTMEEMTRLGEEMEKVRLGYGEEIELSDEDMEEILFKKKPYATERIASMPPLPSEKILRESVRKQERREKHGPLAFSWEDFDEWFYEKLDTVKEAGLDKISVGAEEAIGEEDEGRREELKKKGVAILGESLGSDNDVLKEEIAKEISDDWPEMTDDMIVEELGEIKVEGTKEEQMEAYGEVGRRRMEVVSKIGAAVLNKGKKRFKGLFGKIGSQLKSFGKRLGNLGYDVIGFATDPHMLERSTAVRGVKMARDGVVRTAGEGYDLYGKMAETVARDARLAKEETSRWFQEVKANRERKKQLEKYYRIEARIKEMEKDREFYERMSVVLGKVK